MSTAPNSARYCVIDAIGREFLTTFAGLDYEARFRAHARWWVRHRTRPGAHRDKDALGRVLDQPIRPVRVVVEPYHDPSSQR